jgi:hypothetical protein
MNRRFRLYAAVTLVALLVAGCGPCDRLDPVTAPVATGGSADFSSYVALGANIGAGYQSGGLVSRHQLTAYPALFAGRIGAEFTYPAVSDPGIPALLRLVSLSGPVIVQLEGSGSPTNLAQALSYTNLSVPGAVLFDVSSSARYGSGMFPMILRGMGTMLAQAVSLQPTFLSLEFGSNEVLGPASSGSGTPVVSAGQFSVLLDGTLDALQGLLPDTKMAIFTVPDVTAIPFVTTIKPYFLVGGERVYYLCTPDDEHLGGRLNPDDYVLLTASGYLASGVGIPAAYGGTGAPLPGALVLTATEASSLRDALGGYNASIRAEAAARGMAVVDLNGLMAAAATTGIQVGGVRYSSAFLTGGLFSLDGAHPSDMGQGLIANTMIDAVNRRFGSTVAHVSLPEVQTHTSSAEGDVELTAQGLRGLPRVEGLEETMRRLFPAR